MSAATNFNILTWQKDRLLIGDLLFRLELSFDKEEPCWAGNDFFKLFKPKELVEQYEHVFSLFDFQTPKNIFEIGMYDGGSLALWNELFKPDKLVGIDIQNRDDSIYFTEYSKKEQLSGRLKPLWGVDQSDRETVKRIARENFESTIDLIIDDACHYYKESKISFETLFPLLSPGGLYVIEDWQWAHWKEFQNHDYFQGKQALTNLIADIIALTGSALPYSPKRIQINSRMVAIERGNEPAPPSFSLPAIPPLVNRQSAQTKLK